MLEPSHCGWFLDLNMEVVGATVLSLVQSIGVYRMHATMYNHRTRTKSKIDRAIQTVFTGLILNHHQNVEHQAKVKGHVVLSGKNP